MLDALDDLENIRLQRLSLARSPRGNRLASWSLSQIRDSRVGQLAAYCATIAGAIVGYRTLAGPLQGSPWWIRGALIALFPLAAFSLHGIPALIERRRVKQLAEISGQIHSGYFRLSPRDDEESFSRADGKHHEIMRWIEQRRDSALYLTGVSGSGKSSLLAAWVLPQMRRQNARVILLRGHQDLVAALARELEGPGIAAENPQLEAGTVRALLEQVSAQIRPRRLLIVVDQFEEFVILQNAGMHHRLRQLFHSLHEKPVEGATFLFVARSDYIGIIEKVGLPPLLQDVNWQEVPPFTEIAARDFVQSSGLRVKDELLRGVLREAAEIDQTKGLIRPITINLCGLVLARFAAELPRGFRPGGLIRGFLRESVSLPAVSGIAPRLLPHLISNYVTKRPRTIAELAQSTGTDPAEVRGCLRVLGRSDRAIVRPVDADQQTWEISHDFLVPLLDSIVIRWTTSFRRRLRPWLPWIAASVLAVASLVGAKWEKSSVRQLEDLGWHARTNDNILELQFEGIPPKESTGILQHIRCEFHITLERPAPQMAASGPQKHIRDDLTGIMEWRTLKALSALDVVGLQVTDVSPLSGFTNLSSLRLKNGPLDDVSALKNLTNLSSLDLSLTSVTDLSPLKGLKKLTSLDLHSSPVTDLSPLKDLTSLEAIELTDTPVTDISPLSNLTNLTNIFLPQTPVQDISPLRALTHLDTLELSFTQVHDLRPLKNLKNLSTLDLHATQVTDVTPLKDLTSLTDLNLGFCPIKDVTALKNLVNLSSLDLTYTRVDDVSALENIKNLSIRRTRRK
jgi:Leucine-rich repeat (LRR) protein